jgi:acetyltransferase-like isoleucine patch superfamily enzyme
MSTSPDPDFDHTPWIYQRHATPAQRAAQMEFQAHVGTWARHRIGGAVFLSSKASYTCDLLEIGDHSWVAAGVLLHGQVRIGRRCSLNPYSTVRGRVTLGDEVRVAHHAHLIGFDHRFDDPTRPIAQQGIVSRGLVVGDDVWIGAGAIVLDGLTIGAHSVVAAGAVVTKDVPAWSVVAGNPARVLRDRRSKPPASLATRLREFGQRVAAQWPAVLERSRVADDYVDPFSGPLRPLCDAVEIAACFDALPPGADRAALIERLQSAQDPASGLVRGSPQQPLGLGVRPARYLMLATGHALECLGSTLRHPVHAVAQLDAERLRQLLASLPWQEHAWSAGDVVDAIGSAIHFNHRHHGIPPGLAAPLFDWLREHAAPHSGLWGQATAAQGWLQPVNGFYRIARGTYAGFGLPLPHPESTIDSVLAHARLNNGFRSGPAVDACNLLDVVFPLWLAGRQTDHRRDDVRRVLEGILETHMPRWLDAAGFAFAPEADPQSPAGRPGLQGTEMGVSIVFTAAQALGLAEELGYKLRGIHRLSPST